MLFVLYLAFLVVLSGMVGLDNLPAYYQKLKIQDKNYLQYDDITSQNSQLK